MFQLRTLIVPAAVIALAACQSPAEEEAEQTEDMIEQQAEQSADAAGMEEAALGLTEAELLDTDLVGADGSDFGDIEQVRRNDAGDVEGFIVSVEDAEPERYVLVALDGLSTRASGGDIDIMTEMSRTDFEALPDASMDGGMSPGAGM